MTVFSGAVRLRPDPLADEGAAFAAAVAETPDLDGMTVSQLRAHAREHGIEVPAKATKAQLVAAIEGGRG